jgi:hypothetical protein
MLATYTKEEEDADRPLNHLGKKIAKRIDLLVPLPLSSLLTICLPTSGSLSLDVDGCNI